MFSFDNNYDNDDDDNYDDNDDIDYVGRSNDNDCVDNTANYNAGQHVR